MDHLFNAEEIQARNANMKAASRVRLATMTHTRRPDGAAHNRKASARLSRRINGWDLSMRTENTEAGGTQQRKESGGFKCPGSLQVK